MSLQELIKTKRPNIADSTLKSYVNCLRKIKKDLKLDGELKNAEFLHDTEHVIKYINGHDKITTKKNKLTCIIVALDADKDYKHKHRDIEIYQTLLKSLNEDYNLFLSSQTKTSWPFRISTTNTCKWYYSYRFLNRWRPSLQYICVNVVWKL